MTVTRLFILVHSLVVGLWVFGSFVGVTFDLDSAGFWNTSLTWSLLTSLLVMPTLVFFHHATAGAEGRSTQAHEKGPATPPGIQPSFVRDEERDGAIRFGPEMGFSPEDDPA